MISLKVILNNNNLIFLVKKFNKIILGLLLNLFFLIKNYIILKFITNYLIYIYSIFINLIYDNLLNNLTFIS